MRVANNNTERCTVFKARRHFEYKLLRILSWFHNRKPKYALVVVSRFVSRFGLHSERMPSCGSFIAKHF